MNTNYTSHHKRLCILIATVICACTPAPDMISKQQVVNFLHQFERLAAKKDFSLVLPHIHEDAVFRFNDGDFSGHSEIKQVFEKTWAATNPKLEDRYYLSDIHVVTTDRETATATYTYNWEGTLGDHEFSIRGRGTRVLVRAGTSFQIIHEHLSQFPAD